MTPSSFLDGLGDTLGAAPWAAGAITGILIVAGCWGGGILLIARAVTTLRRTRPGWWVHGRLARRRLHRTRG